MAFLSNDLGLVDRAGTLPAPSYIMALDAGTTSLRAILLDKDGRAPALPAPTDADYWVKRPTARSFDDCCNEFWNLSHYVVKGLCRGELFYAAAHLGAMREELFRMLGWELGLRRGFTFGLGKGQKFLGRYLEPVRMRLLEESYGLSSLEEAAAALQKLRALFQESSRRVSEETGCSYPDYDEKVSRYLDYYLERMKQHASDSQRDG